MICVLNYFVMQRIVTDGDHIFLISTGSCTHLGPTACYSGFMFLTCFIEFNLIWIGCSYWFRYYTLHCHDLKARTIRLIAFCQIVVLFFLVTGWISFFNPKTSTVPAELLSMESSEMVILGGPLVYNSTITVFAVLLISVCLVLILYFWIRDVLINFRAATYEVENMNMLLVKVYKIHVILSMFTLLGIAIFFLQFTKTIEHHYLIYTTSLLFMISPILSPFSYLLFLPNLQKHFNTRRVEFEEPEFHERRRSSRYQSVTFMTSSTTLVP
ncbi:hypothetical protein CRE_02508 [Caenorhabditis remanei]|uniref:Uncharacterized protein n=1 Tax=Caenorhabditis remanei TaxID=31234 RepID=E3MWM5_CAERE|nr:hypothetical protein CRE_02508 [Caenorhabditis remanei]